MAAKMTMTLDMLMKFFGHVESKRFNWNSHWQDIKDVTWVTGGDFTRAVTPGEEHAQEIFDPTAALALGKFMAVLESLLTPRNDEWHGLRPSLPELQESKEAKVFFEKLTEILFKWRKYPGSGFSSAMAIGYKSLGAYGNQCLNPMKVSSGGISYKNTHIGSVWVETDDRGRIDTVFHKWKMTAMAAHRRWGDRAPESVKEALEEKPYVEQEFLHIVMPREDVETGRPGPLGMKYESWEIGIESHQFIPIKSEIDGKLSDSGGFNTLPYIYSRYTVDPSETYGRGPMGLVLPANQTLQEQERTVLISGQLAVEPPILSASDNLLASTDADGFSLIPGAVMAGGLDSRGNPMFRAFDNGYKHPLAMDMMQAKKEQINDALLIDLFQILVENPQMTATEVMVRAQEKGQLITPLVGRQHDELLGPTIERELDILAEQGLLPEMPEVLKEAEGEYEIVYDSSATRMQKEEKIQAVRAAMADVIPMLEIDSAAGKVPNYEKTARWIMEQRQVPPSLINSEEEVEELMQAEAEAKQAQDAAAAVPDMARAAKDLQSANLMPTEGMVQ